MSYNVLAPSLLDCHAYLYNGSDKDHLSWNHRSQLFLKQVKEYNPDILCLQEVEEQLYESFYVRELSGSGYRGIFKKRTGDKFDGCAIFYKADRFSLLQEISVEYYQPEIPILNRDNVALMAKLESKEGNHPCLLVCTTHLLYNPKRHDIRAAQMQLLLAELDKFSFKTLDQNGIPQHHPVILTGDLNAGKESSVVQLISNGTVNYSDLNRSQSRTDTSQGLLPYSFGVTDQCQHMNVILDRLKIWYRPQWDIMCMRIQANNPHFGPEDKRNTPTVSMQDIQKHNSGADTSQNNFGKSNDEVFSKQVRSKDKNSSKSGARKDNYLQQLEKNDGGLYFGLHHQTDAQIMHEMRTLGISCEFNTGQLSHRLNFRDSYEAQLDRKDGPSDAVGTTHHNKWTCVDYIFYSLAWNERHQKLTEGNLKLLRRLGLFSKNSCREIGKIPNASESSDHYPLVAEFLLKNEFK